MSTQRNMAHFRVELRGRPIYVALHTRITPSDAEWRAWTRSLEDYAKESGGDLGRSANLVITDGGSPNTSQRTAVNNIVALGASLPPVAVITSSLLVRTIVRAFTIFNEKLRVFAPDAVREAAEHVGITPSELSVVLAEAVRVERAELGRGAVQTLADVVKHAAASIRET